jgi:hypothetical protein
MKIIARISGPMCDFHKPINKSYGEWMLWAEDQKRHGVRQRKCKVCGHWFWPEEFK